MTTSTCSRMCMWCDQPCAAMEEHFLHQCSSHTRIRPSIMTTRNILALSQSTHALEAAQRKIREIIFNRGYPREKLRAKVFRLPGDLYVATYYSDAAENPLELLASDVEEVLARRCGSGPFRVAFYVAWPHLASGADLVADVVVPVDPLPAPVATADFLVDPEGDCLRAARPGYSLLVRDDPSKRRGLWARRRGDALELAAGREGDDAYLRLTVGDVVTAKHLDAIVGLAEYARAPEVMYLDEESVKEKS